jgi:hypothetical protein
LPEHGAPELQPHKSGDGESPQPPPQRGDAAVAG